MSGADIYVDGNRIGEIGGAVLKDRKIMANDGILVVIINIDMKKHELLIKPNITTRGFILVNENEELIHKIEKKAEITIKTALQDPKTTFASIKTDITFVCNAMLQTRVSDVYITYLTDHPASHKDRLTRLDERSVVFVCDRRHEAYVRKYCPNIRHVKYIPLSGEAAKQYIPYSRRSRDLVFTGSYRKPEDAYRDIFLCDESVSEIARYLAESIIENPQQDLEMCLQNCLELFDTEVTRERFHELVADFGEVDRYARVRLSL